MKYYTKMPNEILEPSQLSISARYLYCVLLKHCGKDEWCFPSQKTLAETLSCSERHIRNLIRELEEAGILFKKRRGWNRSNTYKLTKSLSVERIGISYHLGSKLPLQQGSTIPPKNTYLKGKGKRSKKGKEKLRKTLEERRII